MGASTRELFGGGEAEPATPGSYGESTGGPRLPAGTRLGPVHLQVSDLARSRAYYERVLGLVPLSEEHGVVRLGAEDGRPLVILHERRDVQPARGLRKLGLYHFAILLPDRAALGRFVRHVSETGERVGAGDHLVSEAFYLHDPDGLGIEVYADRPREAWRRSGRELMMATDPVDVDAVVAAGGDTPWTGLPAGTVIGHVHLHVGDLPRAEAFYGRGMGFDRMAWSYPGALFFGADGYHHHVGTNTWAGPTAQPPGESEPRLLEWTLELPAAADVATVEQALVAAGHGGERVADALVARDPWGTAVRVQAIP